MMMIGDANRVRACQGARMKRDLGELVLIVALALATLVFLSATVALMLGL